MQNRSPVQQLGRFTGGLIDNRIEGGGPRDQGGTPIGTLRIPSRALGQNVGKMPRRFRNELRQQGRQPPRRISQISQRDNQGRANDADADLRRAADSDFEYLVGSGDRRADNDDKRVTGQDRRIGREVAQEGREEGANRGPRHHRKEKDAAILRENGRQRDGRKRSDRRAP